jgi:hypothetical protein
LSCLTKTDSLEQVNGNGKKLAEVNCEDTKIQLADQDLVIGKNARDALADMKNGQKSVLLGIRAFLVASIKHLQKKLPFENSLLRDLSCLDPRKRQLSGSISSVENVCKKLCPNSDVSKVHDEWIVYQTDPNIMNITAQTGRIDHYWNQVLTMTSSSGLLKFENLTPVVKAALVLAQTNAESERSLSVNANIVTKDRTLLSEPTIQGLRTVKDAVHFKQSKYQHAGNDLHNKCTEDCS